MQNVGKSHQRLKAGLASAALNMAKKGNRDAALLRQLLLRHMQGTAMHANSLA